MVIKLYNENSSFNAHTKLQSTPVTIDVDPVGISVPSGALRLNYDKPFTHVQFELSGEPYICKVTNVKNLGGNLNEYSYSIDYLKDYVNKHGLLNQDIVIGRSTASELWRKMIVDNQFPRSSQLSYTSVSYDDVACSVMIVVNYREDSGELKDDCTTYFCSVKNWSIVQKALLNPMTAESDPSESTLISPEFLTTAIRGVYLVPCPIDLTSSFFSLVSRAYIKIYAKREDGTTHSTTVQPTYIKTNAPVYELTSTNTPYGLVVPYEGKKAIVRNVSDWRDIELYKYSMYAPFYGAFELNPQHYTGLYYYISPSNGMVSVSTVLGDMAGMLEPKRLPEISYITDTSISAQKILNQQTATATGAAAAQAALSLAVSAIGAASGNALMTAGGVLGAVQSVGNSVISAQANRMNQMYAMSQQGLQYSPNTGTFGTRLNKISITRIKIFEPLSMTEFANRYGYYCDYKIGDSIPESVQNRRCWLDLHGARLRGADWYASGVRAALDGACIIID